jgi:hypothetical protein
MLSMMSADLRLTAVARSLRPRMSSGVIMDSAGASTDCTKVVAPSLWTQSGTSVGRAIHDTMTGMNGSMSRLPTTAHTSFMALVAAVCTQQPLSLRVIVEQCNSPCFHLLQQAQEAPNFAPTAEPLARWTPIRNAKF